MDGGVADGPQSERVLVLGGTGMLGHKVWQVLASRFDTYLTAREPYTVYAATGLYCPTRWYGGIDADQPERLASLLTRLRPTTIVNCIGIVKQRPAANVAEAAISVNSLFPHRVAAMAQRIGASVIHVSTDCVFSGRRGGYRECDLPDPIDLYGRSKLLGELDQPDCLTLRTSIIGHELRSQQGLVEWFRSQDGGRVQGYANAIFSGVPTLHLATCIADLIARRPRLSGLYHLAAPPISKYDLLLLLRDAYGLSIEIERDETYTCNRSLDAARLAAATSTVMPPWPTLVAAMAADSAIDIQARGK